MALTERQFSELLGLREARAQLRQLPLEVRKVHYVGVRDTAEAILARAKAAAPVRREGRPPGYAGGTLRDHLALKGSPATLQAIVGIEQVALVVRTRGRRGASVTTFHDHKFRRARDGKWRRRVLSRRAMDRLQAVPGTRVIRPTTYGHLQEFGAPQHAARPFLRPAVQAEQEAFRQRLQAQMPDLERALAARGYWA